MLGSAWLDGTWLCVLPSHGRSTFTLLGPSHVSSLTEEYDAVPFVGEAVPHAHAGFLETVARLRGMRPAPAEKARVLELGCGVGSNLLPMAERYPEATFVGVDLSGRQIEMAQSVARECGLVNVEFRQADVMQLGDELGQFDYIITHGVYSWVEAPVRDKLLSLARTLLAEQGVAYFGYKTYPAWHQFEMLRAMMLQNSRDVATRQEKLSRSRATLAVLNSLLSADAAKHGTLLAEIARLAQLPDGYLWHEYLEAVNHPVYFQEFHAHAAAHDLQYMGDGAIGVRMFDELAPQIEQPLAASFSNPIQREQYRDIASNRSFRQTLLCRGGQSLSPRITPAAMNGLYLEAAFTPENPQCDLAGSTVEHFVHRAGGRVTTADRGLKAALVELGQAWPGFVLYEELVAAVGRRLSEAGSPLRPQESEQLEATLIDCCERLAIQLHSHAPPFAVDVRDRPQVSRLARAEAVRSNRVSNRRHEPATLHSIDRWLLTQFDGQATPAEVIARATEACATGKLVISVHGVPMRGREEAERFFQSEVPAALKRMAEAALLVA